MAQVVAQHFEQLARPRLENFSYHALRNQPRGPVANRGNFDLIAFRHESDDGIAIKLLDSFRFIHRRTQTDRQIAGEMIAANRNDAGVRYRAVLKHNQAGGTGSQIGKAHAQFALIGAKRGIRAGQRLKYGVIHVNAGAVHRGDDILRGARSGRDHVHADFQTRGHHAQRVTHTALLVENELLWQQMQDFAVGRQGNRASLLHCHADFVASNFAGAGAEADSAVRIHSAGV